MPSRRHFLKSVTALGIAGATSATATASAPAAQAPATVASGASDRAYWIDVLEKVASPVLDNLARRELRKNMPVEIANPTPRVYCTHLEAFGRTLTGIAPWLAAPSLDAHEAARQKHFVVLAQQSLDAATDPRSPDFLNFYQGRQPLVDTAFMAQGILRAPSVLWQPLDARVQRQIIEALLSSRAIATPAANNWVLFAAMIEAALQTMGEKTRADRLENCVDLMLGWYKGDGAYGDGAFFHWDYYDSFVIHPMLLDVLAVLKQTDSQFEPIYSVELARAKRYAQILERLIAPDGSFPSLGRSTTYRFGAFHALAQIARARKASASALRDDRRDSQNDRSPRHIRRSRLAANRFLRPPAHASRVIHFHRQPISLQRRSPAPRPAALRRILERPARAMDLATPLVRPVPSPRSRHERGTSLDSAGDHQTLGEKRRDSV
jgi:hypothetical protein